MSSPAPVMEKPTLPAEFAEHIKTLDGWRALAALAVVACHFGATFSQSEFQQISPFRHGALGVDFFFGLSGFLITLLLLKELRQTGTVSLKAFYMRRFFRIAPACLVFIVCLWAAGRMQSVQELIGCLFFFRNYLPDELGSSLTKHLWSLAVEAHFYLFWPPLLLWVGFKRGASTAAYIAMATAFYRLISSQMETSHLMPTVVPMWRTDMRLDALLWGCVLAFVVDNPELRAKFKRQFTLVAWLGVAGLFWLFTVYPVPITNAWDPLLIALLIAGTALHEEWLPSRFLELNQVKWLGRISFSLYIWQEIIYLIVPGKPGTQSLSPWLVIPLIAICTLASYYLVEIPVIRFGRRWMERDRQAAPVLSLVDQFRGLPFNVDANKLNAMAKSQFGEPAIEEAR